jgi:pimeloyl-ACP methyl ester carboxylesterase
MKYLRVNDYDMAYIEVGSGTPLVCVHGSLCDFRVWSALLGPLSRDHRVIAVSVRHYFPEHWDGVGPGFTMAQHVADMTAFIEALGAGPVNLMGHSRGGHIAFRVAQHRPDLVGRLILAEPGGDLDASLAPADRAALPPLRGPTVAAVEKIAAGDVEGGLELFIDALEGKGAWRKVPAAAKQEVRDNARTLLGQINEQRQPYARADAEAISAPTLFIGGANTPGALPVVLRALASHVPRSRTVILPNTTHFMLEQDPVGFCAAVLEFLAQS